MNSFDNQRIIVTGGTRGIGAGITQAFLKAQGTVIATYKGNDEKAEQFIQENQKYKDHLDVQKFDVSNPKEVENFFGYLDKTYPSIEVLINNSGIRKDAMMAMMSDDDWNDVLNINLKGTFNMARRAVLSFMKNRYGRIINISSIGGNLGLPGQANYAASKAGQVALSKSLSKEVAKKGITVNNVCPGFIDTEFLDSLTPEQKKEYTKQVPVKRFGTVMEVASGVLFLASKEASYITGASLDITGGLG